MSRAAIKKRLCMLSALIALCVGLLVVTFSVFTDYVNQTISYTVANFSADGYALERTAPDGYFTAGEDVSVKIKESSTVNSAMDAQLSMSAAWSSPDPDSLLWGNADKSKDAVLMLDGVEIPYTVKSDGSISFSLPKVSINASSSVTRDLTLEIPASLSGTGTISFSFDEATVKASGSSRDTVYSKEDLNKDEDLSFSVGVAWNISKDQSTKDIMAYLDGNSENYDLEIIKNGKTLNTNNSKMMDFTIDKSSDADDLIKWSSSAPWYSYRSAITSVSLPEELTSIGDGAFLNLSAWGTSHLTVPEKVSSIGEAAFGNVNAISSVTIPKSVKNIESLAFGFLPNAGTFTFEHDTSDALTLPDNSDGYGTFYVGDPYSQTNPRNTKVAFNINAVKDYNWGADNRGFLITIEDVAGGTLTADRYVAIAGQDIVLSASPEGEFRYDGATYTFEGKHGSEQSVSLAKDELAFTMPESSVTVSPKWLQAPMLAANRSWYKGTDDYVPEVTQIDFVDLYDTKGKTIIEQWDASDPSVPGTVTAYIEDDGSGNGTYRLTISGNGYGLVYANPDSSYALSLALDGFGFMSVADITNLKLLDTSKATNMGGMFCFNTASELDVSHFDTSNVTIMDFMFGYCNVDSLDVTSFVTTNVKSMNSMFSGCSNLKSLDLSQFDTQNVEDMGWMFSYCNSLEKLDLTKFKTENVTNMNRMFSECGSLAKLDVSSFNTSNVEDMAVMFEKCSSLESLDLSSFDTQNVTDMWGMFTGCSSLTSMDLSTFTTIKVESMSSLFKGCTSLETVNLASLSNPVLTSLGSLFSGCTALKNVNLSNFNTSAVTDMSDMFRNCSSIESLDLSSFDTSLITGNKMNYAFSGMMKLDTITLGSSFKFTSYSNARLPAPSSTYIAGASGNWYSTDEWVKYTPAKVASAHGSKTVTYTAYPPALDSIEITKVPNKVEYEVGETFDPAGMVVKAHYTHKSYPSFSKTLADDSYTILDGDNLQEGTTKVTVSHTDTYYSTASGGVTKTDEQPITVKPAFVWPMLAAEDTWYFQGGTSIAKSKITSIQLEDSYSTSGRTIVDEWDASDPSVPGTVTAYIESDGSGNGTYKLTLAGNGAGKIYANKNSTDAFANFTVMTKLDGLNSGSFFLDTSKTEDMFGMFSYNSVLTSLDLSGFDTSNTTSMTYMFLKCFKLESVDLSSFNTENVETISGMFWYCNALKNADVGHFNTSKVTTFAYMFSNCKALVSLDLNTEVVTYNGKTYTAWDVSNATRMELMFDSCYNLTTMDVGEWNTSKVTDTNRMFGYCNELKTLDIATKTVSVGGLSYTAWNTGSVKDMSGMFTNDSSLTALDIRNWDVSNVTDLELTFNGCQKLTSLDVSSWDVRKVENMGGSFANCTNLTTLEVSTWKTDSLKDVNYTGTYFRGSVRYYDDMGTFYRCNNLDAIDISGWNMRQVTNSAGMFSYCYDLNSLTIPASLSVISPEFANHCQKLTTITFLHTSTDALSIAPAGKCSDTEHMHTSKNPNYSGVYGKGGPFHTEYSDGTITSTKVKGSHPAVANHDWRTDLRSYVKLASETMLYDAQNTDTTSIALDDDTVITESVSEIPTEEPSASLTAFKDSLKTAMQYHKVDHTNLAKAKAALVDLEGTYQALTDDQYTKEISQLYASVHESLSQKIQAAEALVAISPGDEDDSMTDSETSQSLGSPPDPVQNEDPDQSPDVTPKSEQGLPAQGSNIS